MMSVRPVCFALALATLAGLPARAETLRLAPGDPLARMSLLTAGPHRYLRYKTTPDGARQAIDIWTRQVSFEPQGGARALHIVQRWDEVADKAVLVQDSWFDAATFQPRTHVRRLTRDGKVTLRGYRFADGKVVGMTDLADNDRKDFVQPMAEPAYNFEYDMEFLQVLPMAAGRTFDIPFYDPGIDKPGRYRFVVAGSARIGGPDGRSVDCWLVTADYNTGHVVSRFWFAKAGQVMIREEQVQPDGGTLVKTLLPPESADT